ncbi:hypothetical protein MNBD_GAMMA25-45 [hydrothermal vent metagenome]|uniref:Rhamnosyl O-methyltransferase n=1 Tax=hydrothermal vent metagenome TaxID=652676 RepID=A0A3B1B7P2_9ZZZZ
MGTLFRDIGRLIRVPANRAGAIKKLKEFHSKQRSLDEVVDTAMDMGSKGHYRINSMQVRSEIMSLAKRVNELKPKVILEIGTCNGGTLFMWSNLASMKVISCDLIIHKYRKELYDKFSPPESHCVVVPMEGDSHNSEFRKKVEDELNGEKVDFLFIDGDHSEKGAEADYYDYKKYVRPGGLIAFHDIVKNQPVPGNQVHYLWQKIKQVEQIEEFIHDQEQCGYGIGLVKVS